MTVFVLGVDSFAILDWLELLWPDPPDGWLTLFTKERATVWHPVHRIDDVAEDAATAAIGTDVWFGVGLRHEQLPSGRGGDRDVTAIPGLWVDVDVAGPGHKTEQPLPASIDEARQLLADLPVAPTAVIATGGGVHGWWLTHDPIDAELAAPLLARWGATWKDLASRRGWHVDDVWDLARVMRLPGTLNHKTDQPRPVELLDVDESRRYSVDDLNQWLQDPPAPERAVPSVPADAGDRPGDRFNNETTGDQVLEHAGWTLHHTDREGDRHWTRPGKERREGHSATVYADNGRTTVFTSSVPALPADTYDPWGLHVHLQHAGDFTAAASAYRAAHGPPASSTPASSNGTKAVTVAGDDQRPLAGIDGRHYTEVGNAERLIAAHGDELRYVPAWGRWLRWDGSRWSKDDDAVSVIELAKDVPRQLLQQIHRTKGDERKRLLGWSTKSESAANLVASVRLARSIPGIAIGHGELDANDWTLNAPNGIIDLRTCTMRPPDPDALCTLQIGTLYEEGAGAPTFRRFIDTILPDPDVAAYVQRFAGYCLTGDVSEQVLNLWWGAGRNGKSVLVNIMRALLGDYAAVVVRQLLTVQRHEGHPTALADLFRARLGTCVELRDGSALDETRIKMLTGGDTVKARRMREDHWTFEPTAKLLIVTNHRPQVRADDFALWRRVHLVPFTVTIPEHQVDKHLADRIIANEMPGVLEWALEGCASWQQVGLAPPAAVLAATDEYRASADTVTAFLADENLVVDVGLRIASSDLQDSHEAWCTENGIEHRSHWQDVQRRLKEMGAEPRKSGSKRWWFRLGYPPNPIGDATP